MNRATVDPRDPTSYLPLTPAVFHILLALSRRDRHGYGIITDVRESTEGRLELGTGTLYTALKRLLAQGLIEEVDGADGERRRSYRILSLGREVAAAETERLRRLVGLAERQLLSAAD